jgi:DNA-directed RNA polymerase subunit RPC12/RpoP
MFLSSNRETLIHCKEKLFAIGSAITMHAVIVCYKCGRYLLATMDKKTRQCPYCEAKLILNRTKIIASAKTAREASNIIRTIKEQKENKGQL